jgi:tetratricopeptide (TPR) repeat protein
MGPPSPFRSFPVGLDAEALDISDRDPIRAAIWRAWSHPSADLGERARRTQRSGLAHGLGNLVGPANALLLEPSFGTALERAELATEIAPDLPASHAALAAARFRGWKPGSAWQAFLDSLDAAERHLEGRLWLEATGSDVLFGTLLCGALGFLALAAAAAFPRFARDFRSLRELPGPSAGALAASIVLLPAALGEGLVGIGLGLFAFALVNGSWWRRACTIGAAAMLVLAIHPALELRAERHAALAMDEIAVAAWSTEQGTPTASELARVVRHADSDPLAGRALALRLARQGELVRAEERFTQLVGDAAPHDLTANLAAVHLQRGDLDAAIALYEEAAARSQSAVVRFNLAQAFGRAIRLDEQDLALSEAQAIDPDILADLNHRYNGQDGAIVAYLPLEAEAVLGRIDGGPATPTLAAAYRRPLAPGRLGRSSRDATLALGLAALLGLGLGALLARLAGPDEDLYAGIARLLQTRGGDSMARMAQIEELRARQTRLERIATVAALFVPGAAGMVARRPLLAAAGVGLFACAASLFVYREGAVADPLALGALPAALVGVGLVGLALLYLLVLALAFALREGD